MNIFYISPWPISSPLSFSTVVPHLKRLLAFSKISRIDFFATESDSEHLTTGIYDSFSLEDRSRLQFHVLPVRPIKLTLWSRFMHHRRTLYFIKQVACSSNPDIIFCRGTASIFGHSVSRSMSIPYVVESFEPHAEYMRQTGTWLAYDPRYLIQRYWDWIVKRSAIALITVSEGYVEHLKNIDRVPYNKLFCVPCWVDTSLFFIDVELRERVRHKLNIENRPVAVYAGKFGGIYCPVQYLESLRNFQDAFKERIFVIVLTDHEQDKVHKHLEHAGFSTCDRFVAKVPFHEVNSYLNAADFSLSFINSGPWSFACSAIKHGEYWATGLPIVMPKGIGDESHWLEIERAGVFVNFNDSQSMQQAGSRIAKLLEDINLKENLHSLAINKRNDNGLNEIYYKIINELRPDVQHTNVNNL